MNSAPAILVSDLHKSFVSKKSVAPILQGISFEVFPGEIVGFLGANGSGKTTTLSILAHLLDADRGTVEILGKRPGDASFFENVSFVSGDSEFAWSMRVKDILGFYGALHGIESGTLFAMAERHHIAHRLESSWDSLSAGEKTRVRLTRGMLKNPHVMLLDEPTVGLDPEFAATMRSELARLGDNGVAVLLTSHYMKDIEELADKVCFLHGGKLVATGPVSQFRATEEQVMVEFSGPVTPGAQWKRLAANIFEIPLPELSHALTLAPARSVHSKESSLEEYYISVIRGGR